MLTNCVVSAEKMLSRAHALIENYKGNGVSSDRILIRLPATWQGIQAAKQLESEGIAAHVTLIYRSATSRSLMIDSLPLYSSMLVPVVRQFGAIGSIGSATGPAMAQYPTCCTAVQLCSGTGCSTSWCKCDTAKRGPYHGLV